MEHEGREGHGRWEDRDGHDEQVAREVVDAGLKVHRALGPGLLESAYEGCLARELEIRRIPFRRQQSLAVTYEGITLDSVYRLDLVVSDAVVLEIKAVEKLSKLHEAQLLTYLRLSKYRIGFLMNFDTVLFKQGLWRMVR